MKKWLEDRDYKQSDIDPCVLYRKDSIILCYIDDCIIITKRESSVRGIINSLVNGKEHFELTDIGNIERYLGVEIKKQSDDSIEL